MGGLEEWLPLAWSGSRFYRVGKKRAGTETGLQVTQAFSSAPELLEAFHQLQLRKLLLNGIGVGFAVGGD